jgi:hypothetical protein
MDILAAISNTSMVRLGGVVPPHSSRGQPGAHKIEGVGIGYAPPLWDPTLVDEIVSVSSADAMVMARRIAREEGLFAGASSGANVAAAIQVARRLGARAHVVTLMVDSGLKYLSTAVYRGGGRQPAVPFDPSKPSIAPRRPARGQAPEPQVPESGATGCSSMDASCPDAGCEPFRSAIFSSLKRWISASRRRTQSDTGWSGPSSPRSRNGASTSGTKRGLPRSGASMRISA